MENKRIKFAPSGRRPIRLGSLMMKAAAVLACLVLLSFHLMTGLYAKYSSTATGSDSARVAKFDVEYKYDSDTRTITIINNSEVTVAYEVTYLGLPEGVTLSSPNDEGVLAPQQTVVAVVTLTDNSEIEGDCNFSISLAVSQVD